MNQPLSGPGAYTPVPPIHPDDAHEAALTVCEHAHHREDARLLLHALGILGVLHGQVAA